MKSTDRSKVAIHSFRNGCNCAQSVVSAFVEDEYAQRVSAGFGGGIGMTGNVCGAVSGGVMVLGLLNAQSLTNRTDLYDKVSRMTLEFEKKFGSLRCDAIQQDKENPEIVEKMADDEKFCDRFVRWVVSYIEENVE